MVKSMFHACTKEFSRARCTLNHLPADDFVKSQWQNRTKNIFYLFYRWILAIFFIAVVAVSMSPNKTPRDWGVWFIYLTHWGILLCLFATCFAAALVTIWYFHPQFSENLKSSDEMPISFKIYWVLHNTTLVISIVITLMYWGILYDDKTIVDASNVLVHAMNSVTMFIDLWIVAYPTRLLHLVQPMVFGAVYSAFSLVYFWTGGTNEFEQHYIYNVLDWSTPKSAISTTVGSIALTIVIHCLVFLIYRLRIFLYRKLERNQEILATTQPQDKKYEISMVVGQDNPVFTRSTNTLETVK